MFDNNFLNIDKNKFIIHFVGIGGNGMSSIAEFLFLSGYKVTGSDINFNLRIKYLLSLGIKIYKNHSKNNILNSNLVVYSSAINYSNCELVSAKFYGIPIIKRIKFLSELLKFYYSITVVGSHGKTTTTSFIFDLFLSNNIELNCINGDNIKSINSYIYLSNNNLFLLELDESDGVFIYLNPTIVVLTNIDYDHLNNYSNKINNLIKYFIKYIKNIPFYGYLIACIDNPIVNNILQNNFFNCNIITYGFNKNSDFNINKFIQNSNINYFSLNIKKYNKIYNLSLDFFGKHNVLNCVASISLLSIFKNIEFFNLQKSLYSLKGVYRRSEILGEFSFLYNNKFYNNILFIIDYGHHPTEIKYVINSIYNSWKNRRLIMIFQPHRFSRTKLLFKKFSYILSKVNILLLLDIYNASENNSIYFIKSINLLNNMYDIYGFNNCFLLKKKNIFYFLFNIVCDNDIILFQGAGDIDLLLFDFISKYIN